MDAQRSTVEAFARQHGGAIVGTYVEVESGKRSDRPELAKALQAARKGRAVLLIAKLDRLARNVAFISRMMDAGVDFVACDQPFASRLTLHILAAVAEDEARRISERTKAALQVAKARGSSSAARSRPRRQRRRRAARSRYAARGQRQDPQGDRRYSCIGRDRAARDRQGPRGAAACGPRQGARPGSRCRSPGLA